MSDPIFRLAGVTKVFGDAAKPALAGIDLDIERGAFLGVVGTSGAGKSTLLRLLNLLETPTGGSIAFNGRDLARLDGKGQREYLSKVATIFQHFNLIYTRNDQLDDPRVKLLARYLTGPEVKKFIDDNYRGFVIADQKIVR